METLLTENGTYCLLCPPGGALTHSAKAHFRRAAQTGAPLLYGDSLIDQGDGKPIPAKRPSWAPDTLLSFPCIGFPAAVAPALLQEVKPLSLSTAAGRYEAMLALSARISRAVHIAAPLYRGPGEEFVDPAPVVARHLRKLGRRASVGRGLLPGTAAVRYAVPYGTGVCCIVYGSWGAEAFRRTLESIACVNTDPFVSLLAADGCPPDEATACYLGALRQSRAAHTLWRCGEGNLARLCNLGAMQAREEALLFLPAGCTLKSQDGLKRMLEYALLPGVGCVFGDAAVPGETPAPSGRIIHNVSGGSPPVMLRRDTFLSAGGFDETFTRRGFAQALCFLLSKQGKRHVCTPYARFDMPPWMGRERPGARNEQREKDLLFQIEQEAKRRLAVPF